MLQRYDLAAESLAQVQGVSKENAEASYWLARTYQAQGTEAYARLQESFPDSWRACQLRAEGSALRLGILTTPSRNFTRPCSCVPMSRNFMKRSANFISTIILMTPLRKVNWREHCR